MKKIIFTSMAAAMLLAVTGCSDERDFALETEGTLQLSATFSNDVKVASRGTLEDELGESCIIWISSERGLVRKYEGINNLPVEGIKLVGGKYVVEAWAGDSVSASYDKKYYKGYVPFTITSGSLSVNVPCKIANVVTSVTYSDGIENALTDYTLTVSHPRGSLDFDGRDNRKGYFMMPTGVTSLDWVLKGTKDDGTPFSKTGVIENVKPATEYVFNVRYSGSTEAVGGAFVTIEVDETTIDVNDEITISTPPLIQGYGFNIAQPVMGNTGSIGKQSVYITSAAELTEVILKSSVLEAIIGGDDINLLGARESVIATLSAGGVSFERSRDTEADTDAIKIRFSAGLLNSLAVGNYDFVITATDAKGMTSTATMTVNVSEAKVEAVDIDDADIDYREATIKAALIDPEATGYGFLYRETGTSAWKSIAANALESGIYSATITDLTMGHTYEYKAVCDDYTGMIVKMFTTKSIQLPNSGFEDWQTASAPYLIYPSGGAMFWDSGNHGSSTMGKNVTVPATNIKHSGNYSIKLESQFVGIGTIGKFAAGNVFIGQYLDTQGTDGVLGWGRPFSEKPVALRGYVKYNPATVAYESKDFAELKKGDMDEGIIYIALLDNHTETYSNKGDWPVVIKTASSSRQLFDKNSEHVIAYGELVFKSATSGSGMVEFNIPLTYLRTDVDPSFIMCTAAASRGGDFFVGGPSVMYLDDLELVY